MLLLHSLVSQEKDTNSDSNTQTKTAASAGLPKTKKRKHMSALEQDKTDRERERAIMAYRMMRKQRLQEKNGVVWRGKSARGRRAWISSDEKFVSNVTLSPKSSSYSSK